nr:MAG TPA: hypothetical protein [Caudoviricetes sp.]
MVQASFLTGQALKFYLKFLLHLTFSVLPILAT